MGKERAEVSGFENAFHLVGGHGRFQWLWLAIASVQLMMMAWNHMGYIFIGAVPKHWCNVEELSNNNSSAHWTMDQIKNISIPRKFSNDSLASLSSSPPIYEQCRYYDINYGQLLEESKGDFDFAYELVHGSLSGRGENALNLKSCEKWTYDQSIYKSTIVTEFDLVCGRRFMVATIQATYMLGAFTGNLIFGPLMDEILGRRKACLLAIVIVIIGGFLASFSVSYWMFVGLRFIIAIGAAGSMQAFSVWLLEHCDTKSRASLYCISSMFFGIGYAILPIFGYFIREWSTLQLAFSVTTLSLVSLFWFLPESPRWLASNGRDEEAAKALMKIAKVNGMPAPNRADLMKVLRSCHNGDHSNEPQAVPLNGLGNNSKLEKKEKTGFLQKLINSLANFRSLVATAELRRISFPVWGLFTSVAFIYYGFAFASANMITSDPYLLVSLGALMEIPASLIPIPFLSRWGRRPTILSCYVLTGISSLAIAMTPVNYEVARTVLSMAGKLFVASAFTIMYLVAGEIYPTVVRSTGRGTAALMGRFGSTASPFVADLLTTVYPDLPLIIFGIVALGVSLFALLIPEMKDADMKDQVYEYDKHQENNEDDDVELKENNKLNA